MSESIALGVVWAEVQLKVDQVGQAKRQVTGHLGEIGNALDRLATQAEKDGRRIDEAMQRAASEKTKRQADANAESLGALFIKLNLVQRGFQALTDEMQRGLDIAGQFEQSMDVLQAVSGATAQQMDRLRQTARDLGADITLPNTSSVDAAHAMTELAKAGLSVEESMNAAKGSLQLAAAAGTSAAKAAEIMGQALNVFHLSGDQASHVADLLAGAANAAAGEIGDMSQALKQAGPIFSQAGISIEDTVASIAQLAKAGILGSDAGTSLKEMLLKLESPTKKSREVLDALGISIYDAQGKMRSYGDIIDQFSTKVGDLVPQQRDFALATIFGSDAVRAATTVMLGGRDAHDEMVKATNKNGEAARLADAQMKGFKGSLDGLKSALDSFREEAWTPLLGGLTAVIKKLSEGIGKAQEFIHHLREAAGGNVPEVHQYIAQNVGPDGIAAPRTKEDARSNYANRNVQIGLLQDELYRAKYNREPPPHTSPDGRPSWGPKLSEAEKYGALGQIRQITGLPANDSTPPQIEAAIKKLRGLQVIDDMQAAILPTAAELAKKKASPAPKPTGTKKNTALGNIMTGDDDGSDQAEKDAKALKESQKRAAELRADADPRAFESAYQDLLAKFRKADANGEMTDGERSDTVGTLRTLSRRIARGKRSASSLKLSHADATDKPTAQATYDIAAGNGGTIDVEEKKRQEAITEAVEDGNKKRSESFRKVLQSVQEVWARIPQAVVQGQEEAARAYDKKTAEMVRINDNLLRHMIENREIDYKDALRILDAKLKKEKEGSDEWVRLYQMRKGVATMQEREAAAGIGAGAASIGRGASTVIAGVEANRDKIAVHDPFRYIRDSMAKNVEAAKVSFRSLQGFMSSVMDTLRSAFAKAVGEMAAKWATIQFGGAASAVAGPGGAIVGGLVSSLFGGFRESGGPVQAGRAYVVGEKRPEMFVPKSNGYIMPHLGGMGSSDTINVHVYNPRMDSAASLEQQSRAIAGTIRTQRRIQRTAGLS